jgi:hypothetical protein
MKIATAGRWDPTEGYCYFLAHVFGTFRSSIDVALHHLIAVNEIARAAADQAFVDEVIGDERLRVLFDSGVFNLANTYAIENNIALPEALAMAPDEMAGFAALFDAYVAQAKRWSDKAWGFIEIDLGGRDNKIKTRGRLEALGLRPIPVFHPFSDGWDYFDALCQTYDRVAIGNLVQVVPAARKRLAATIADRWRKFPEVWIHLLGVTPSPTFVAFPYSSSDSSTWVAPARWGQIHANAATQRLWPTGRGWTYDRETDPGSESGHHKSWRLSAYSAGMIGRIMRDMTDERRRLGMR